MAIIAQLEGSPGLVLMKTSEGEGEAGTGGITEGTDGPGKGYGLEERAQYLTLIRQHWVMEYLWIKMEI